MVHLFRGIAQLVEQRSPKPRAEGSNPSAPAIFTCSGKCMETIYLPQQAVYMRYTLVGLFHRCYRRMLKFNFCVACVFPFGADHLDHLVIRSISGLTRPVSERPVLSAAPLHRPQSMTSQLLTLGSSHHSVYTRCTVCHPVVSAHIEVADLSGSQKRNCFNAIDLRSIVVERFVEVTYTTSLFNLLSAAKSLCFAGSSTDSNQNIKKRKEPFQMPLQTSEKTLDKSITVML